MATQSNYALTRLRPLLMGYNYRLKVLLQNNGQIPAYIDPMNPFIAKCLSDDLEYTLAIHDIANSEALIPALKQIGRVYGNNAFLGDTQKIVDDMLVEQRHFLRRRDEKLIKRHIPLLIRQLKITQPQKAIDLASRYARHNYMIDDLLVTYFKALYHERKALVETNPAGISDKRLCLQLYRIIKHHH